MFGVCLLVHSAVVGDVSVIGSSQWAKHVDSDTGGDWR